MEEMEPTTKRFVWRLIYTGIIGIILVLFVLVSPGVNKNKIDIKPLQIKAILGGTVLSLTVAATPESRSQGLSGYKKLEPNEGMFFIFQDAKPYGFWMKEMLFPIDMIWFDSQYRIIFVKEDAEPSSYPEIFSPQAPAQYVLEVPSGFFASHHLKFGDVLKIER